MMIPKVMILLIPINHQNQNYLGVRTDRIIIMVITIVISIIMIIIIVISIIMMIIIVIIKNGTSGVGTDGS